MTTLLSHSPASLLLVSLSTIPTGKGGQSNILSLLRPYHRAVGRWGNKRLQPAKSCTFQFISVPTTSKVGKNAFASFSSALFFKILPSQSGYTFVPHRTSPLRPPHRPSPTSPALLSPMSPSPHRLPLDRPKGSLTLQLPALYRNNFRSQPLNCPTTTTCHHHHYQHCHHHHYSITSISIASSSSSSPASAAASSPTLSSHHHHHQHCHHHHHHPFR